MDRYWSNGDPILLREVYRGRVWAVRPVRVVEDSPDRLMFYIAPGTRWLRPVDSEGTPLRLQTESWQLAEGGWSGSAGLRIVTPSRAHSVLVLWDPETWAFQGWYINLEEPLRRTSIGFDYLDQVLDIVVAPDRTWRWKDEGEFAIAQERGLFTRQVAREIRTEGERVIEALAANASPFADGWEAWRPPSAWLPAPLSSDSAAGNRRTR